MKTIKISDETYNRLREYDSGWDGADITINNIIDRLEEKMRPNRKSTGRNPRTKRYLMSHASIISVKIDGKEIQERNWRVVLAKMIENIGPARIDGLNEISHRFKRGRINPDHKYIETLDLSIPIMGAYATKECMKKLKKHFNLDVDIEYKRQDGQSGYI